MTPNDDDTIAARLRSLAPIDPGPPQQADLSWNSVERGATRARRRRRLVLPTAGLLLVGAGLVGIRAVGPAEDEAPLTAASDAESTIELDAASAPDEAQVDLHALEDFSVVRVASPTPPPGATEPTGRCFEFSAEGQPSSNACLFDPGVHVWRLAEHEVLLSLSPIPLGDGSFAEIDADSGLALVDRSLSPNPMGALGQSCFNDRLIDVVLAHVNSEPVPFTISQCTRAYAVAKVQYLDEGARNVALLFGEQGDGGWSLVATIDFGVPDPAERCANVPDNPVGPPGSESLLDLCTMLG